MEAIANETERYPIGRVARPDDYSAAAVAAAVGAIEGLPRKLLANVSNLTPADWGRQYRPGSWTVRQVTHHIVDANLNNYTRFKFALTEDNPVIKPYLEDRWAELADSTAGDMRPALDLLSALHNRWVQGMRIMEEKEWRRGFFHPDLGRTVPLFEAAGLYAWHGEHHLGQIRRALGH
jgi:uncharacterized damage-inducible protein DinB